MRGSKGMRTGRPRTTCGRGRPRTTCGRGRPRTRRPTPPSDRARSVGERSRAPSLRDAPPGCASNRTRSIAPRRASTPTTAQDRSSFDTGPSRHREVEQIRRGGGPRGHGACFEQRDGARPVGAIARPHGRARPDDATAARMLAFSTQASRPERQTELIDEIERTRRDARRAGRPDAVPGAAHRRGRRPVRRAHPSWPRSRASPSTG